MILQESPNKWSCLPTSFAMALDKEVQQVLSLVGHNGSEIIWPKLKEPYCRRSFHIQEMILISYALGYTCTPFEAIPVSKPLGATEPYAIDIATPQGRMNDLLFDNYGVLIGLGKSGLPHAVAWDGYQIFDPNGTIYNISSFTLETFWYMRKK